MTKKTKRILGNMLRAPYYIVMIAVALLVSPGLLVVAALFSPLFLADYLSRLANMPDCPACDGPEGRYDHLANVIMCVDCQREVMQECEICLPKLKNTVPSTICDDCWSKFREIPVSEEEQQL